MGKKLQPPKNFRISIVRICATCRYLKTDAEGGVMECKRGEVVFDTGDRDDIISVCDGWRNGTPFGPDAVEA